MGKGRGDSGSAANDDIGAVDAAPQRGRMPGGVPGDRAGRANAPPQRGTKPGGVVGGSGTLDSQTERASDAHSSNTGRRAEEDPVYESPLEKADARLFRGVAARLYYLGPDRPDMQYAIKEAARCMASPRQCDWPLLKKIGRYLLYRPRLILRYKWQKRPGCIDGYTNSDWAGCTQSRISTSGGVIMVGHHVVKSYSKQQKVLALSSAEAEPFRRIRGTTLTGQLGNNMC